MSWVECSQVGRGNWISLQDVLPVLTWGVWRLKVCVERLNTIWENPLVSGIGRQDTCPSSELLCSEGREAQTGLLHWLWDPG